MLEHHGNFAIDVALNLTRSPVRPLRMTDDLAGFQHSIQVFHCGAALQIKNKTVKNNMPKSLARDIAAMMGSRICHDLISPIGAISNGVELLAMSNASSSPELTLISESVANANARVKFFRVAFGAASSGQMASRTEMANIFKDLAAPRTTYTWGTEGDMDRQEAKLACLMVQCLETAMPRGGELVVAEREGTIQVSARAERLDPAPELWARLSAVSTATGLKPSEIQFLLAPLQAELLGRRIRSAQVDGKITLSV